MSPGRWNSTEATTIAKKQARFELDIAEALSEYASRARFRPRQSQVHRNRGGYLSPDTLWKAVASAGPSQSEVSELLQAAKAGPDTLERHLKGLLPTAPEYGQLVNALAHYRHLCAQGGWEQLNVPKFTRGRRWKDSEAITKLQRRLTVESFYEGPTNGTYGDATEAAVKRYQSARSLRPKGTFAAETANALNVPCQARIDTLVLNLHRWRHTARRDERTYFFVNLPGFEARYIRDGELRTTRRVIVGKGHSYWSDSSKRRIYANATPLLKDRVAAVVLNPSWTMPGRLVRREILPRIEKDPDYLAKKGYIEKIAANGIRMIVQPPGPDNALGDVKFSFSNKEAIYMHDTDKPGLFHHGRRDFSHGCIRVDKAVNLASMMLDDDHAARQERFWGGLSSLAKQNNTAVFKVEQRIPVFLEYYTASVSDEGTVRFHPDIYDYDYMASHGPIGRRRPKNE